jgi:hypothetical protein
VRFFFSEGFSLNKPDLSFMAFRAIRCGLMVAPQALHSRPVNLSMFLSCRVAGVAVQYSCDMFPVWKWKVVDLDFCILKSLVALTAF